MLELMNTAVAAQELAKLLPEEGKTQEQWLRFLQNNRNASRRVPYRIPHEILGKVAIYQTHDLKRFADFEKQRAIGSIRVSARAAEALHAFGKSRTGRKLRVAGITPQIDDETGEFFVQIIIAEPLLVFRLSKDEAAALASELTEAAEVQKEQKEPVYETLIDNDSITVKRLAQP